MSALNGTLESPLSVGAVESPRPDTVRRKRIIHGSAWTIIGYGGQQILRLGSNLVLTRMLFPRAFGLMSLVQVFMQGLQMFSDVGIGPSIIQSPRGEEESFLNTAWTIQVIRGFCLTGCAALVAYPVSNLYGAPELAWLLPVSALTALISGFNSTSLAVHGRRMALGRLTAQRLTAQVLSIAVMIVWAYFHRSPWALVAGNLTAALFVMIASHIWLTGIKHRFQWNSEAYRELFTFGRWIFLSTALAFLAMQLDRVLLGRLVPLEILGVYSVALILVGLPQKIITMLAAAVLFPLFSEHARSETMQVFSGRVCRVRGPLLGVGLAVTLALMMAAPLIFRHLYDSRYAAAAWMGQLLCIYTWFILLQNSADRALLALGASRAIALSNLANVVTTASGCYFGYQFGGMIGFIVGLTFSSFIGHTVVQICLLRHGINIIGQDVLYSLGLVGSGLVALVGNWLITSRGFTGSEATLELVAWALGWTGAVSIFTVFRFRRMILHGR
jgi:O-antigen/teichoic acid export membrane protein